MIDAKDILKLDKSHFIVELATLPAGKDIKLLLDENGNIFGKVLLGLVFFAPVTRDIFVLYVGTDSSGNIGYLEEKCEYNFTAQVIKQEQFMNRLEQWQLIGFV
jgi:hypothetical protein